MATTAEYVVLMTTVGSVESAGDLARGLVEEGLVACAQRLPIQSVYRWGGAVVQDEEVLLLLKTRRARAGATMDAVRARHPYEVPEILELPITDGWPPYLRWIDEQTTPTG